MAIPLSWYLIVAAVLFCIGIYGVLARRNAVGILMGVELMLNAVNINLVAFWRYLIPPMWPGSLCLVRAGGRRGGSGGRPGVDHQRVPQSRRHRRGEYQSLEAVRSDFTRHSSLVSLTSDQ